MACAYHLLIWNLRLSRSTGRLSSPKSSKGRTPGSTQSLVIPRSPAKTTIGNSNAAGYLDWLKQLHTASHGNSDLVAHFFRRAFNLARERGVVGPHRDEHHRPGRYTVHWTSLDLQERRNRLQCASTDQVAWRSCGRRQRRAHCQSGHDWPQKTRRQGSCFHLRFLFHGGGHDDPERLAANSGKSFVGSYVLGMGFTFDDTDKKDIATPLSEMHRLIDSNPDNQKTISPTSVVRR